MKWWDETGSERSLSVPSDIDAITVMTIHKSKGLEYPCVHIPFAEWQMKKLSRINWFEINTPPSGCIAEFRTPDFDPDDVPPLIPMEPSQMMAETSLKEQFDRIVQEDIVDNLNKTYVAFTRASRELIVGYKYNPPKKAGTTSVKHVGLQIAEAIKIAGKAFVETRAAEARLNPDVLAELSPYIDDNGHFVMGSPTTPLKKEESATRVPVVNVAMDPYRSADNEHIWKMNKIDDIELMQTPRRQGIVYHTIMSRVRHASDLPRSVRQAVADGLITDTEATELTARLQEAIADEKASMWFNGFKRLLNERTMHAYSKKKNAVYNRRPDRIVWCADGSIHIVDYKFGNEEPPKYISQVNYYMYIIGKLFPGVPVKGCLWYPLQRKFIDVTPTRPRS